ncbi:MAG: glycerophosphodiester phosphodiesterase [Polyangiaceae bacterium]|nr:glycerophosphodiester phosphodiesterase [Polyangiaceae bacterium]
MTPRLIPLALLLVACGADDAPATKAPAACADVLACGTGLAIAHRGGGALAPEETAEAMDNAVALGADVLELDVHRTSDGVVVCMHDDTVDRTTNGTGKIKDKTFTELRALDAGYRFSPDGASFPRRGAGVVVATLEELLLRHPTKPFSVELKQSAPSIVDDVIAVLRATGASKRVVVASFSDVAIAEMRQKAPDVATSLSAGEMVTFTALETEDEATYRAPGGFLQAPVNSIDADRLARARRLGLRVQVWTVNDRATMDAMLELGVDGVMSDDPRLLGEAVAAHRAR